MAKVPVGKSIAHAYEFLFGRIFQIIGTAWLPALLYAVGYYFWLKGASGWLAPLTQDKGLLAQGIAASIGMAALGIIVHAIIGISLTQEALGVRKDLTLAHFVIGPRELRLFFAQIRLLLIIIVLDVVMVAAIVIGLGLAKKYGAAVPPSPMVGGMSLVVLGSLVAAVLLYVAFGLTVLKLSFLLTAVAAVEHRASVRRGWQLAGGSGWRILLVLIGTFLPLVVIVCGVFYALAGPDLAAAMQAAHAAGADHLKRGQTMLRFYSDHAMLMASVAGIVAAFGGALMAGATAAAYRTVTGHEADEPEDDSALVAPLLVPAAGHDDHGHGGGHDDHGHGGGHDDHGGGHDDHGHGGGHDDHGHGHDDKGHGHDDHGHGHDDHGHGGGHDDHGHGNGHGHDDAHGHGGHDDHGHGDDDDDDHGHGGHDDHGHGHDDHGHGGGHGDHGHGHDDHGHGHGGHGHDDHGHGGHGDGHHHHARAA